jgi:hypothetical protein
METRTRTTPEKLNVLAARLKLWLLDVCLWLSEWMGRALPRALRVELRAEIAAALAGVRVLVFLRAVAHCPPAPAQHGCAHAPPGFRLRGVLDNDLRNVCRTVKLRGRTIAARLRELRDALDNLDVWIARAVKRLKGGAHGAPFVLCGVSAERLLDLMTAAPAFADSS